MESVFALDIGTRMVMGLLMAKHKEGYEILSSARTEHSQRAMYDGQVHDVDEVALAVSRIKDELEQKTGLPLRQAAVAAAGRALITERAEAERHEIYPIRWEREDVLALEMEAVQLALRQIESDQDNAGLSYHCVGYSLVESYLDGQLLSNLIGQRGKSGRVEVIATFLPRSVIDGLVAVLGRVGLDMQSLTLEPIAAGQAAIPFNMRRMNLALVDVGAGTSDIALTQNGTFFAYGMVPMAGDEVTEVLAERYLLDFHVGEKVKREINGKKRVALTDFFGKKTTIERQELVDTISPVVCELANKIAAEILKLNHGMPQAIILIGGGSLTPMLPQYLAEAIGLPVDRVGIQIRERLPDVAGEKEIKGPDGITPIGIGMTALEEKGLHYYSVWVNDIPVPIFELQLATVAEALLAAGIQPRSFLGKPGAALTFELNGEVQIIKGSLGKPAQLLVNGQPGKLEQTLRAGDKVLFTPGVPGQDGKAVAGDILSPSPGKRILWNGEPVEYPAKFYMSGQEVGLEEEIVDGAKLVYLSNDDLQNLFRLKGVEFPPQSELHIRVKGEARTLSRRCHMTVNGRAVEKNISLANGDRVEYSLQELQISDLAISADPWHFHVNGKPLIYPPQMCKLYWRGRELQETDPVEEGMEIRVEGFKDSPILSHILPLIGIPTQPSPGAKLVLTVNGKDAEFTTPLRAGDRIAVGWT